MDLETATRGAEIVTEKWLNLDSRDVLLIVTDDSHADEAQLLKDLKELINHLEGSKKEIPSNI